MHSKTFLFPTLTLLNGQFIDLRPSSVHLRMAYTIFCSPILYMLLSAVMRIRLMCILAAFTRGIIFATHRTLISFPSSKFGQQTQQQLHARHSIAPMGIYSLGGAFGRFLSILHFTKSHFYYSLGVIHKKRIGINLVMSELFHVEFIDCPSEEGVGPDCPERMKRKGPTWDAIVEANGLVKTKLNEIASFDVAYAVLNIKFQYVCSMNKSREFGFFKSVELSRA